MRGGRFIQTIEIEIGHVLSAIGVFVAGIVSALAWMVRLRMQRWDRASERLLIVEERVRHIDKKLNRIIENLEARA